MDSHENSQRDPALNPANTAGDTYLNGDTTGGPPPERYDSEQATPEYEEPQLTFGQWLQQNAILLLLMGALFVYLALKFDAEGLWAIAKAAIGLNFVIFVHELGHFLVARWCDVHVQVFSIGFGPALPGCSFKWGETTWKLALFPLGGYVQMVGQVDGEEAVDPQDTDPRSYRNKSVWQRMGIISAGVIMNALLAVVCFVIVFQGPGKDRKAGVVALIDSKSPAFKYGIRPGCVIDQIGSIKQPYFEDLLVTVMASTYGEQLTFAYHLPGKKEVVLEIEPRLDKDDKRPIIGISPSEIPELQARRYLGRSFEQPIRLNSAASRASQPFEFGDRIVAMSDPDDPQHRITPLPLDPRKPGSQQRDYFQFQRRLQMLAGEKITFVVERQQDEGAEPKKVKIEVPPAYNFTLGARMQMGQITSLRDLSPAARAGVQMADTARGLKGDVILGVEVKEPDGRLTRFINNPVTHPVRLVGVAFLPGAFQLPLLQALNQEDVALDPVRLPSQLKDWAARLKKARVPEDDERWTATLILRRHNSPEAPDKREFTEVRLPVAWDTSWTFDRVRPFYLSSPLAIAELGLAYQVQTNVVGVDATTGPGGLQTGDVIEQVRFDVLSNKGEKVEQGTWSKLEPQQWGHVSWNLQSPDLKKVLLKVNRNKEIVELEITPQEVKDWPQDDRGLILALDVRRQKADNFFAAAALGMQDTHNHMMQVFQSLRGMLTGRISVTNLGGPVTIARVAYTIAGVDFWEFLFFLGMISINLAVINFLPIPVLDGGHMVFLIYEKIRGQPASEGVRVAATYAGLLLLASLMIFVLYLDISRLF